MIAGKVTALVKAILDLGGTEEEKELGLKEASFLLATVVDGLYPAPPTPRLYTPARIQTQEDNLQKE